MTRKRDIAAYAVVVTALLVATALLSLTGDSIDAARERAIQRAWMKTIERVIDVAYDQDPIDSRQAVTNEVLFGTLTRAQIWTLVNGSIPTGHVIEVPVPEAYNDELSVAVGIDSAGRVTGVNVPVHNETSDYGARLIADEGFLQSFIGRSGSEDAALWTVITGSGGIDGVSGATITKTAVTNGVFRALRQYQAPLGTDEAGGDAVDEVQ